MAFRAERAAVGLPRALRNVREQVRLRFPAEVEQQFSQYYLGQSLPFTRLALVLAFVLYALFGILDLYVVPDVAHSIWVIRYAVVCPLLLVVLGLTFTSRYPRVAQPVLCFLAAVLGFGIVAMIAIADASDGYLYYAGLLLVVPWTYTVLQLRFGYATAACVAIMVVYEFVAIWVRPTPVELLLNNNFFFLSAVVISMVAGYTIERGVRRDFSQRRVIEAQRADLAEHNVQLDSALQATLEEVRRQADELRESRARVVHAADAERRRIERDLHDGAQQHLVALRVNLRLTRDVMTEDPSEATAMLDGLADTVQDAISELRTLAHGIYPPLLMESGLPAALRAAADRCPLEVELDADVGRYPADVEAAVYFCSMEAMQNACKHADGSCLTIRVWEEEGLLHFVVADDGPGFDAQAKGRGHGYTNMSDRLGSVGGSVRWESEPGAGTRVCGRVPMGAPGSS